VTLVVDAFGEPHRVTKSWRLTSAPEKR